MMTREQEHAFTKAWVDFIHAATRHDDAILGFIYPDTIGRLDHVITQSQAMTEGLLTMADVS